MLKANLHLESDFAVFLKFRFYSFFVRKYNFSFINYEFIIIKIENLI